MTKPLVTVITPAYNCAAFIGQTVDSLLEQDYYPIEYKIIDDCSTDGTLKVIGKYRIPVSFTAKNMGEQAVVNYALQQVFPSTKYFMIVNADDPLLPGAISKLVEFMEAHPDVLCAYPDWESINEDGSHRAYITTREYNYSYMLKHHTCIPSVGSMFRREVLELVGYRDTSFHWLGDFDYWYRVGLIGKMARVPETLACWRHRNGQASGQKSDARAQEHIRLAGKVFAYPLSQLNYWYLEKEGRAWAYLVAASVTDSKKALAEYVVEAVKLCPGLFWKPEFIDTLAKRAAYLLRR